MRALAFVVVAVAVIAAAPARAQTYDPNYPVCMHLFGGFMGGGDYFDCTFLSLPQCQATASGRPAMCIVNPYFAGPPRRAPGRRVRAY